MQPISFRARIRYWNPEKASGLAVADIPEPHYAAIGGLRQQHVKGTIGGQEFASNVMPAGGGRLALSVNKAMMKSAGVGIGDEVAVEISAIGRDWPVSAPASAGRRRPPPRRPAARGA